MKTPPRYYPPANHDVQWFGEGNYKMPGITKLLLHTTETMSWPGYAGGGTAPQLTYDPWRHIWRQHFPLFGSGRALRDPSGTVVRENRDNVLQVEIICYSDEYVARQIGRPDRGVTKLDDDALRDLAELIVFLNRNADVPIKAAPLWLPYPQSYGNSAARMSGPEYDSFAGVLGHQHASGNSHGDPGALNITRIMELARELSGTVAPATWPPAFPGRDKFGPGKRNRFITLLGQRLVKKGYGRFYKVGPGPSWGDADRLATRAFQLDQGWRGDDADGFPGPLTWRRLFS